MKFIARLSRKPVTVWIKRLKLVNLSCRHNNHVTKWLTTFHTGWDTIRYLFCLWKYCKTKTSEHYFGKRIFCLVSVALSLKFKTIDLYLCYLQRIFKALWESFKSYWQSMKKNSLIITEEIVLSGWKSRIVNCLFVVALQPWDSWIPYIEKGQGLF